jgi:hypothetical protein
VTVFGSLARKLADILTRTSDNGPHPEGGLRVQMFPFANHNLLHLGRHNFFSLNYSLILVCIYWLSFLIVQESLLIYFRDFFLNLVPNVNWEGSRKSRMLVAEGLLKKTRYKIENEKRTRAS